MYNKYLKSFIIAADLNSFNKAAAKLNISPTAVMRQMDVLGETLGVNLLNQTNNGIRVTYAGEYIYKESKEIINRCDDILAEAKKLSDEERTGKPEEAFRRETNRKA
jgi:DNA-binding transcriptional LysR family regulator